MRSLLLESKNPLVAEVITDHPLHFDIEKTRDMEDLEFEYGKDLRILMLEALADQDTQRQAANSLDMFPPTFSHWLRKLGIVPQARAIRRAKKLARLTA